MGSLYYGKIYAVTENTYNIHDLIACFNDFCDGKGKDIIEWEDFNHEFEGTIPLFGNKEAMQKAKEEKYQGYFVTSKDFNDCAEDTFERLKQVYIKNEAIREYKKSLAYLALPPEDKERVCQEEEDTEYYEDTIKFCYQMSGIIESFSKSLIGDEIKVWLYLYDGTSPRVTEG